MTRRSTDRIFPAAGRESHPGSATWRRSVRVGLMDETPPSTGAGVSHRHVASPWSRPGISPSPQPATAVLSRPHPSSLPVADETHSLPCRHHACNSRDVSGGTRCRSRTWACPRRRCAPPGRVLRARAPLSLAGVSVRASDRSPPIRVTPASVIRDGRSGSTSTMPPSWSVCAPRSEDARRRAYWHARVTARPISLRGMPLEVGA